MIEKIHAENTAVMIIDMQKVFVEPGAALCIAGAKETVPAIARFADEAREKGMTVIWVTREYKPDGSDMEIPRRKDFAKRGLLGVLAHGTTGTNSAEDAEGLCPNPDDIRIIKPRFSAFFSTGLDEMLKEKGIDTVILCGTTTPNCIRQTAYDGISYDYRTIALWDCCSSQTDEIQNANMLDMERVGVEIVDSNTVLAATI